MKKLLAFILLLSHVNFFMFIAQLDEADMFDTGGRQLIDINSLTQYIDYALHGDKSSTARDEDDDNARYFHIVKSENYFFAQTVVETKRWYAVPEEKVEYPPYCQQKINSIFFDIQLPPPKA